MGSLLSLDRDWTRLCANWAALRVLLVLGFCLLWIEVGCSIWQMSIGAGDFQTVLDLLNNFRAAAGQGDLRWDRDFCGSAPLKFLSPIKFTFNYGSSSYDKPANCPWPITNTNFRTVFAVLQSLMHIFLFWSRFAWISSPYASPVLLTCAFLWYSAFVLDCQALQASSTACSNHVDKLLEGTMRATLRDFTVICNNTMYAVIPLIDLFLFLNTFVVARAWSQCPNKYGIVSDAVKESAVDAGASAKSNQPAPAPPPDNRRATGSWWRASENARLSELFPRNSVVVGSRKPTKEEMQAHGMSSDQYDKYARIPGCLERIWAMLVSGFARDGAGGAGGTVGEGRGAGTGSPNLAPRSPSINDSFSSSIKGGSANRLHAGAVNVNALAAYSTPPSQRPSALPKPAALLAQAPPSPPRPAAAVVVDNDVEEGGGGGGGGSNPFGRGSEQTSFSPASAPAPGLATSPRAGSNPFEEPAAVPQELPPPPPSAPPPPLFSVLPAKPPKALPPSVKQAKPLPVDASQAAGLSLHPTAEASLLPAPELESAVAPELATVSEPTPAPAPAPQPQPEAEPAQVPLPVASAEATATPDEPVGPEL